MTHWYPSQSGSSNSPFSFQHCFMVDYFHVSLPDMSSWWKVLQTSHGQTPAPQDTHRWDCTPPQEQQLDLKQGATCTISRSNKIFVPLGPNPIKFMRACPENLTLWTIFGPKRWKKWGYGSSSFTCSIHPSASHPILWKDDQQKCLWTKQRFLNTKGSSKSMLEPSPGYPKTSWVIFWKTAHLWTTSFLTSTLTW